MTEAKNSILQFSWRNESKSLSSNMTIRYTATAVKALVKIPTADARRIRSKIEQYQADPQSQANNIKKLQGREGYRLRVGSYRVIFDKDETVLTVIDVGQRGHVYKD